MKKQKYWKCPTEKTTAELQQYQRKAPRDPRLYGPEQHPYRCDRKKSGKVEEGLN